MNPQREAYERIGSIRQVRVLVPSPPACIEEPWFADDPAMAGGAEDVVLPTTGGALSWDELSESDPELALWCADRWLGAWRRLPQPPAHLGATRQSLHALGEYLMSPYRRSVNGKIGLRYTYGGIGTPFVLGDRQLRIDESGLWLEGPEGVQNIPMNSLRVAGEAIGILPAPLTDLYESDLRVDIDAALILDRGSISFIGEWFGFATSVLEQLRAEADAEDAALTRVQIWPEHFDLAIELGTDSARASLGASPGDDKHEGPYFYVAPWSSPPPSAYWDGHGFVGAQLELSALTDVDDQRSAVLGFFRRGLVLLNESS
ncbi:MAG: hypothetical protein ACC652_00420 [Acidimicrobiales bacterium]